MSSYAAGDFAKDDAGPQRPFAPVVGVGNVASSDEDKEIAAAFGDAAGEFAAGGNRRGDSQQAVEATVEIGAILSQGRVLQIGAALTNSCSGAQ